jgi:hypothetical protein
MVFWRKTYRCLGRYAKRIELLIRPGMPKVAKTEKCQKKFDKDSHRSGLGAQFVRELAQLISKLFFCIRI